MPNDEHPLNEKKQRLDISVASIKCRGLQILVVATCVLTIHKSQRGSNIQILYYNHKNHKQKLVYVALSRVTSPEGQFLIIAPDDFIFYRSHWCTALSIKEVQE